MGLLDMLTKSKEQQKQDAYKKQQEKEAASKPAAPAPAPAPDSLTSGANAIKTMGSSAQDKADAMAKRKGGAIKKVARGGGIEAKGKTRGRYI